jgi:NADPH:quinone reductase-like Zn-dependent oxidoreductase
MLHLILQVAPFCYAVILHVFRYTSLELDNVTEAVKELTISGLFLGCHALSASLARRDVMKYQAATSVVIACQFYFAYTMWLQHVYGTENAYVSLTGKCFIVTGSNTGIGYETVKSLLKMNATVVMACRSKERAEEARNTLLKTSRVAPSKVLIVDSPVSVNRS